MPNLVTTIGTRSLTFPLANRCRLPGVLSVPDELGFLTYKAVGSTGRLSDGEEGFLPVLSRRILVTESLPLPIRGQAIEAIRVHEAA